MSEKYSLYVSTKIFSECDWERGGEDERERERDYNRTIACMKLSQYDIGLQGKRYRYTDRITNWKSYNYNV